MSPEELFYRIFESLPRQGPGCSAATKKAFASLPPLPEPAQVLDVGCGTGTQTLDLAHLVSGTITAVDNHQPFLDLLAAKAAREGLSGRIRAVNATMDALPFPPGAFDLIWSEGAIFIMGFEKGIRAWKSLCKKGGYIVVSDAAWFEPDPPAELVQWWEKEGGLLQQESAMTEQAGNAGLRLLATYRLPEAGWWEHYYVPMLATVAGFRGKYGNDPPLKQVLDSFDKEAAMYRRYKSCYGYTFFVMQAP